jgi:hypothetical protein
VLEIIFTLIESLGTQQFLIANIIRKITLTKIITLYPGRCRSKNSRREVDHLREEEDAFVRAGRVAQEGQPPAHGSGGVEHQDQALG